jgi:Uma2 family endonuclease
MEGTPDWVLEIVSTSSVRKDTQLLRQRYYQAGIAEYWLIDTRGAAINFQILRHEPAGYVEAPARRGGWRQSQVFARAFRLARRPGRMGLWQYTLHMTAVR